MGDIVYLESQGRKIRVMTPKAAFEFYEIGRASCRERVCQYV